MNIYVGNLSYGLDESGLETIFGEYGEVSSVKIIKDVFTGRARGFGFIEMKNEAEGQAAIDKLHGKEIEGRKLTVNKARA